jgi:hypothetical protein
MELKVINFNSANISGDQSASPEKSWFSPAWLSANPQRMIELSTERKFLYQINNMSVEGMVNPNRAHTFGGDFILTLPFGKDTVIFHCDIQGHGYISAQRGQLIMKKFVEIIEDKNNYGKEPEYLLRELGHKLDEAAKNEEIDLSNPDWTSQLFEGCILIVKQESDSLVIHTAGNSAGYLTLFKRMNAGQAKYLVEEEPCIVTLIDMMEKGFSPLGVKKERIVLSPGEEFILFSDGWEHLDETAIISSLGAPENFEKLLSKENTHDDLSFLRIGNSNTSQKSFVIKEGRKPNEKKEKELIEQRLEEHRLFSAYLNRALHTHVKENKDHPANKIFDSYLELNWVEIGQEFLKQQNLKNLLQTLLWQIFPGENISDNELAAIFNYLLGEYGVYYLSKHISAVDSFFLEILTEDKIEDAYKKVVRKDSQNASPHSN